MPYHADDLVLYFRLIYSRRFLDLLESQITSQIKVIRSSSADLFAKRMWSEEARRSLRYAFFLRYCAIFERHLTSICDRFAAEQSLPLKLSDIKGDSFLLIANKYLGRVVNCEPLEKHRLWNDVRAYAWIRNRIVHDDGLVRDVKSMPDYVRSQFTCAVPDVRLTKKGTILLKRRFCYRVVRNMANFLVDVYNTKKPNK